MSCSSTSWAGGACWNLATCGLGTSANLRRGYGPQDFAGDGIRGWAMFDRGEPKNPFRAMSHVIVPYCTADVHAGTRVTTYDGLVTIHHTGARNVDVLLPHLAATFPGVRRVVLVGSSAGGFGAQLNAPKFAASFPGANLFVLGDSAQLVNPVGGLVSQWVTAWCVSVPPACSGCAADFPRYLDFLLRSYPAARFGLLASTRDATLTPFFNYGLDVQAFDAATRQLLDRYDGSASGSYLARGGVRHTWLEFVTRLSSADDVATFDWVTAFLTGAVDRRRP
ncbi:MAG: pectin acetylesterase-family hydrolase [Myxococcaceae bacterium]|nr:pectin acetylesterase-family hydrolase [Myxococcaceae bacterium]